MTTSCVIALDAGTTGVRSRAVFTDDRPSISSYREFTQYFPQPGWVEHDAQEIWVALAATLADVLAQVGGSVGDSVGDSVGGSVGHSVGDSVGHPAGAVAVAAIGIANQRETVLAWNRATGEPYGTAIVWQDRRTAQRCDELAAAGHLPLVREHTGLVLDPYFSGTKVEWLLENRDIPIDDDLAIGTIDTWLIWKLTGGASFATDVSNASRTMLCDIRTRQWDAELCELLHVPITSLAEIVASSGRIGVTVAHDGVPAGIPISGVAGDQHAALFGQACIEPGMAKNTYGTGSFVLLNVGEQCPAPTEGMLTTVAWTLADGTTHYALEGSIFVTGAAIQWLRDGLEIIDDASEAGPLAASVPDSGGVFVVPAFTGLGSPWWDPYARGSIFGITRGTGRAHLTRAVVESMAFQTRDVMDAMVAASGTSITDLRVDGGASAMDLLCQLQADQIGVTVRRPVDRETTSLGAAFLAGLAEGVWASTDDIAARWRQDAEFAPNDDRTVADASHAQWLRAVERSRNWAT